MLAARSTIGGHCGRPLTGRGRPQLSQRSPVVWSAQLALFVCAAADAPDGGALPKDSGAIQRPAATLVERMNEFAMVHGECAVTFGNATAAVAS